MSRKLLALFLALTLLFGTLPLSLAEEVATPTDLSEDTGTPAEEGDPDSAEQDPAPEETARPTEVPGESAGEPADDNSAAAADDPDDSASDEEEPEEELPAEDETVSVNGTAQVFGYDVYMLLYSTVSFDPPENTLNYRYFSSKLSVKQSSGKLYLTGLKACTTTLKFNLTTGKKVTYTIHIVKDMSVCRGIRLGQTGTIELSVGNTKTLTYTLVPSTSSAKVSFSSSNKNVARVDDATGKITAVAEGSATITAKTSNGRKATVKVKVSDPYKPTGVSLKEGKTCAMYVGGSATLTPVLSPSTAHCSAYTWKSSNSKVVSVDGNGKLQARKEGTATITCKTQNGKTATCKITVTDPYRPVEFTVLVNGKAVSTSSTITFHIGDALRLTYRVVSAGGSSYPTPASYLTWSSGSKAVAAIDSDGRVTVKKAGNVTFTLKSKTGESVKIRFRFTKESTTLTAISLGSTSVTLGLNASKQLSPVLTPKTASVDLLWWSSDASVATVDQTGKVSGVDAGACTVYVKDQNTGLRTGISVVVSVPPVYRAVVAVEATDVEIVGYYYQYSGVSTRQTDYDGMMHMLARQNYDGAKWQIKGLHTTSASTVLKALSDLAGKANSHDISMFFFMGHGSTDGTIHFYDGTSISPETLKTYLDAIPGRVIVMLGSCYSGQYIAKSASSFNNAIISTFGKGETVPVTYEDQDGNVSEVTAEQLDPEGEYTPRSGELRASKYYVLTASGAHETGTSVFKYTTSGSRLIIKESESYTYFVRGIYIAGGWDEIEGTNTFTSGTVTLAQAYKTAAAWCLKPSGTSYDSNVKVYPANSSFILFSR